MPEKNIPFNRQLSLPGNVDFVMEAVQGGECAGGGPFAERCQSLFEEVMGVPKVLMTTSCTHALEMAALLLNVGPDDEVIVPAYTFVSTANAFALRGATIRFCDVRPDTLNLDADALEDLITARTKVIVPVHYGGVGCEMEAITEIAASHGIAVVEDNAHGLFGKYRGKWLGSFGSLATQSFHETKNFSCGEGGALLINDPSLIERAEIIREKGTDRSRFFRGQVDKYSWVDLGSSYVISDILAAFLYGQLIQRDVVIAKRKAIWDRYAEELADWSTSMGARLPFVPDDCEQGYHLFYVIMPSGERRQELIEFLRKRKIASVFHYLPLNKSKFGQQWGSRKGDCPVTEALSDQLVRLPFFYNLSESEQWRVIDAICEFK